MHGEYKNSAMMEGAEGLKDLLKKWETLSANLGQFPPDAPILLPDLFVVSQSDSLMKELMEQLSGWLIAKKNLMDFYGDVPCFEFMLNYCRPEDHFSEMNRLMDEVKLAAGFRNVFKGLIHIKMDAWIGHQEELHFLEFMDYLAQNTGDWLIVMSVSSSCEKEKRAEMETVLSMFLRIEKLTLKSASSETYVEELSVRIGKYGFSLDDSARDLLRDSIEVLRKNRYFDSSYTIMLLCSDIVYEIYSHEIRSSQVLSAKDLSGFSSGSDYIVRTIRKLKETRAMGFMR